MEFSLLIFEGTDEGKSSTLNVGKTGRVIVTHLFKRKDCLKEGYRAVPNVSSQYISEGIGNFPHI